jgi:xeroderma pigmentosum group C-complementing protein
VEVYCNVNVLLRDVVHTLFGRVSWMKEGRCVLAAMDPYKIVKARPKWDRMTGTLTGQDMPLEVFGRWQTEVYVPPPAKDGKVPRNEYGNVELFKPWMLPKGTVHLPVQGNYYLYSSAQRILKT